MLPSAPDRPQRRGSENSDVPPSWPRGWKYSVKDKLLPLGVGVGGVVIKRELRWEEG